MIKSMIKSRAALFGAAVFTLSIGQSTGRAGDADLAWRSFAAAQTAKQQCMNNCRARYRDCRRLNQLAPSECRGIYQDCTRYSCTGLGPG
jgi:hypothetical protein